MTALRCGCCAAGRHITAAAVIWNPPGRSALDRRIGRYPDVLERMIAGLADDDRPALAGLTTRDRSDPSIALLDAWACLADTLTFYDERIANEGYLRTATERRSLVELATLVGYRPRPGVAATTYLAFEMEKGHDARLAAGLRMQSVPKPGETAQTFESVEDLEARAAFNILQPQLRRPQVIAFGLALLVETLWFEGAAAGLSAGDALLLYFDEKPGRQILRTVLEAITEQDPGVDGVPGPSRTRVQLAHVHSGLVSVFWDLFGRQPNEPKLTALLDDLALGAAAQELMDAVPEGFEEFRDRLEKVAQSPVEPAPAVPSQLGIEDLVGVLGSHVGTRRQAIRPAPTVTDDRAIRLLSAFADIPAERLFAAWRRATAKGDPTAADAATVFALRRVVGLFGHNAPEQIVGDGLTAEWPVAVEDERARALFLESALPEVRPGGHVVIRAFDIEVIDQGENIRELVTHRMHRIVASATTVNRTRYGLGGTSTRLEVPEAWWALDPVKEASDEFLLRGRMRTIRGATVYCASEQLALADEPDETPVGQPIGPQVVLHDLGEGVPVPTPPDEIRLDRLVDGLPAGRTIVVTGMQAVIGLEGVKSLDVPVAEVAMILGAVQDREPGRPETPIRTSIQLAAPLRHTYVRSSVRIYGNVAVGTHGETRSEILGNGDARIANQAFRTQPGPLTFVVAADASGIASTLAVRVDDVRWHEVDPSAEASPTDHVHTTEPAPDDRTLIRFGDGIEGARPRSGAQNVTASYRVGIGAQANVAAGAITTLLTRPLGLKAGLNPVPATGGAGPDGPDSIRERAPISVTALGRLVSVRDYADFALAYAGVAKAAATRLAIGDRTSVHVTIAALNDEPFTVDSELLRRLRRALRRNGDPLVPVFVEPRRRLLLVLAARLAVLPDHRWVDVERRVRAAIGTRFSFEARSLGQDALLSDAIATMQACAGVDYVDVDGWGAVAPPDSEAPLADTATALAAILAPDPGKRPKERIAVPAALIDAAGLRRAAALAWLDPDLPETLVLTEATDGR